MRCIDLSRYENWNMPSSFGGQGRTQHLHKQLGYQECLIWLLFASVEVINAYIKSVGDFVCFNRLWYTKNSFICLRKWPNTKEHITSSLNLVMWDFMSISCFQLWLTKRWTMQTIHIGLYAMILRVFYYTIRILVWHKPMLGLHVACYMCNVMLYVHGPKTELILRWVTVGVRQQFFVCSQKRFVFIETR